MERSSYLAQASTVSPDEALEIFLVLLLLSITIRRFTQHINQFWMHSSRVRCTVILANRGWWVGCTINQSTSSLCGTADVGEKWDNETICTTAFGLHAQRKALLDDNFIYVIHSSESLPLFSVLSKLSELSVRCLSKCEIWPKL